MKKSAAQSAARILILIVAISLCGQSSPNLQKQPAAVDATSCCRAVFALPLKAKRYALLVGIDNYDDPQISRLGGAANDARLAGKTLVARGDFHRENVFVLTSDGLPGRQATRANILSQLSFILATMPGDGLLFVLFSGHGVERDGRAYLLPADARIMGTDKLFENTVIRVEDIRRDIMEKGVSQVVMALDACRNSPVGKSGMTTPLSKAFISNFNFERRNSGIIAFAVLYATEVGNVAYENPDSKQGFFTEALIEGLNGAAANQDNETTLAALIRYLQDNVPQRVRKTVGPGARQRPYSVVEGFKADDLVITNAVRAEAASIVAQPESSPEDSSNFKVISVSDSRLTSVVEKLADITKELTEIIKAQQLKRVKKSCGEQAYQCFTDRDLEVFIRDDVAAQVVESLKTDKEFRKLIPTIKKMPASEKKKLLASCLTIGRPLWAEIGISCDGQTVAGHEAEASIAKAIVELVDQLTR